MAALTEENHAGAHILNEMDWVSREEITVLSGQNLKAGAVIALVTASGKYVEYDNVGTDGSEIAAGVLYDAVDASAADAKGVATVRLAAVKAAGLVWQVGLNQAGIDAGSVDLNALNIYVR